MTEQTVADFKALGLKPEILAALDAVGYETPSPIQAQTIPPLLEGRDLIGQAQTGTGKTAAFALPILQNLEPNQKLPQALILTPTRELTIQVAEAFQKYASSMPHFHVLPIYGGRDYTSQFKSLKRGVEVVVGTPGRVIDHIKRGTLRLEGLRRLVLDEADEMLRMGFIDDVTWILEQTPEDRQIALFSATMPNAIRRIGESYLNDPVQVVVQVKTATAEGIRQRYWVVSGYHKMDALTRILEVEDIDGMIIFVRTKTATMEVADKLNARGFATAPLNGDIPQARREQTVEKLKAGEIDIIVATDVAARGLDVPRISHVVNYDIPYDTEAYIHRIGRTGRAGREGDAILFVAPRERRLMGAIERATKKRIEQMRMPSVEDVNDKRIARFKLQINATLERNNLDEFEELVRSLVDEHDLDPLKVAAALAKMVQGDRPLLLKDRPVKTELMEARHEKKARVRKLRDRRQEKGMIPYRIDVGYQEGVSPGHIVGAIANEGGIDSSSVGRIDIQDRHTFVDLAEDVPAAALKKIKKAFLFGRRLNLTELDEKPDAKPGRKVKKGPPKFPKGPKPPKAGKPKKKPFKGKK